MLKNTLAFVGFCYLTVKAVQLFNYLVDYRVDQTLNEQRKHYKAP